MDFIDFMLIKLLVIMAIAFIYHLIKAIALP